MSVCVTRVAKTATVTAPPDRTGCFQPLWGLDVVFKPNVSKSLWLFGKTAYPKVVNRWSFKFHFCFFFLFCKGYIVNPLLCCSVSAGSTGAFYVKYVSFSWPDFRRWPHVNFSLIAIQVLVISPITTVLFLRPRRCFSDTDTHSRAHISQIMPRDLCLALNLNEYELCLFSVHDAFHRLGSSKLNGSRV